MRTSPAPKNSDSLSDETLKGGRLGILTGGGDSPGLNAVIRGATLTAIRKYGMEVIGFIDGFNGMFDGGQHTSLSEDSVQGILAQGGTILGTANRGNPFEMILRDELGRPRRDAEGAIMTRNRSQEAVERIRELNLSALLCVGGDGTLKMARDFFQQYEVPVIGVPKTIDFDLCATEATFGFKTAVQVCTDALDRLRTTADSHDRVLILEVMGRYAGWIALHAGIAGGAHTILVPEIPYDPQAVWRRVTERFRHGRRFSLVVVSEGARPVDGELAIAEQREHPDGAPILRGAGERLRRELEHLYHQEATEERTQQRRAPEATEVRVVVLGHIQRGGTPLAEDRIIATACGSFAVDMAARSDFGSMAAWRGLGPVSVALDDALEEHVITPDETKLITTARGLGICLGDD